MFHILGMNAALGMIGGQAALIFSEMDFVRKDVHSCSAVGGAINFFYIGCSALLFTKAHAIFKAFTEGVIGGRTKTYLCKTSSPRTLLQVKSITLPHLNA